MSRDHMLGYGPATQEDWSGLEVDRYACGWGEACMGEGPREVAPRRWIGLTCMTKADQDARQHDVQAGRLGLPMFRVEQPGTLVYCGSGVNPAYEAAACGQGVLDMTEGMQGAALRKALQDLKTAEDLVRSAPPMSRDVYEQDLRSLLALRDNVEREARRCPPPLVRVGVAGVDDARVPDWNDG